MRRGREGAGGKARAHQFSFARRRDPVSSGSRPTESRPSQSRFFAQFRAGYDDQDATGSVDPLQGAARSEDFSQSQVDDDLELDAFDLELLAQSDGPRGKSCHQDAPSVNTGSAVSGKSWGFQDDNNSSGRVSRFFDCKSQNTPVQGLASSSTEVDNEIFSSPLTRFQSRKGSAPFQKENLGGEVSQTSPFKMKSGNLSGPNATFSPVSRQPRESPFKDMPISVRGIRLVPVSELPDRFRSLFRFPLFNAIQSKCFQSVYGGDDNVVLAAPTGSGKTIVMELAIFRLLNTLKDECFKVVYQAPTKSLCAERFRDWNTKFLILGLKCAELTGDTDSSQLKSIQNAQIIITTPEKWDSMTRKWKDHSRLMQLVKLFLIDEVHILKETRGATLEAVVSRMKSFGSNVRFVSLSATIPNSEDIATWLGKDATNQQLPAHREHFGEDFRPVRLQKYVYGYQSNGNDFAFDKLCSSKLPDVIGTHSCKKPIMIFCSTRNSAVGTAKELARLWSMTNPPVRLWKGPTKRIQVHNTDLNSTVTAGVAFHHAGLDPGDRHIIETGFMDGQVSIICCTSTLAVGVNLPCHLVIVKGTVGWQEGGCKEYSELEMMQMLGRAGRPQFDDSATAVILTRKERVHRYEKLVSGSECVESCLHLNLIDHLNAEIGLGTVTNLETAVKWLAGTFLFVRLRRNPTHYKLKENANPSDEDEMLRQICEKDTKLLQETGLVSEGGTLKSTEFGDAMARYYVRFETMKTLLSLKPGATIVEIITVIAQAEEFREVRLKSGEKSLYKEINKANGIRFPIKVDIALPAHKISLLVQSELGGIEFPDGEQLQKHKFSFQQDKNFVFIHINRLIRCVIDCQICRGDSIATRNALELARSFGARVWDDSPLQMKQIEQIGVVAVRKLAAAGITSIEALESTEAYQIDMILSKNPPFGVKLLNRLGDFPKLRVSVKMVGKETRHGSPVKIRCRAEMAFINEKVPAFFQRRPVYVCFLAETSDGRVIDFRRMSASKIHNGHEVLLIAELKSADQHINCYAMCDEIAGTLRHAELKPDIPRHFFPSAPKTVSKPTDGSEADANRSYSTGLKRNKSRSNWEADLFDGDDLFDEFLSTAQETDWVDVDEPTNSRRKETCANATDSLDGKATQNGDEEEPVRLANGKIACNHKCKDKTACKHLCCREGLDKPSRTNKKQNVEGNQKKNGLNQLKLSNSIGNNKGASGTGTLTGKERTNTTSTKRAPGKNTSASGQHQHQTGISIRTPPVSQRKNSSSDYGDDSLSNFSLPSPSLLLLGDGEDQPKASRSESHKTAERKSADNNALEDTGINMNWADLDEWLPFPSDPDVLPEQNKQNKSPHSHEHTAKLPQNQSPTTWSPMSKAAPTPNVEPASTSSLFVTGSTSSPAVEPTYPVTPCGQKREFHFDEKENECPTKGKAEKRPKLNQHEVVEEGAEVIDLDEPTRHTATEHDAHTVQMTPGAGALNDWEDIDQDLLNEFKDIVEFF